MITLSDVLRLAPNANREWAEEVVAVDVSNPEIWLAQCLHESAGLTRFVENLSYSAVRLAQVWPARFAVDPKAIDLRPNDRAWAIAGKPNEIANSVYGGRMGNKGGTDGWDFRGRGPIQVTGRSAYEQAARDTGIPFDTLPSLAENPEEGTLLSLWWWNVNGLDDVDDIYEASRMVNCGPKSPVSAVPHGMNDRLAWYNKLQAILA